MCRHTSKAPVFVPRQQHLLFVAGNYRMLIPPPASDLNHFQSSILGAFVKDYLFGRDPNCDFRTPKTLFQESTKVHRKFFSFS